MRGVGVWPLYATREKWALGACDGDGEVAAAEEFPVVAWMSEA